MDGLRAQARSQQALQPAFRHLPLLTADEMAVGRPVPSYRDWLTHQPGDEFGATSRLPRPGAPIPPPADH